MKQVFAYFSFRGWLWIAIGMLYLAALICCANTVFTSKAHAFDREPARAFSRTLALPQHPRPVVALVRRPYAVLGAFDIL